VSREHGERSGVFPWGQQKIAERTVLSNVRYIDIPSIVFLVVAIGVPLIVTLMTA
jgi:hypothetical protein